MRADEAADGVDRKVDSIKPQIETVHFQIYARLKVLHCVHVRHNERENDTIRRKKQDSEIKQWSTLLINWVVLKCTPETLKKMGLMQEVKHKKEGFKHEEKSSQRIGKGLTSLRSENSKLGRLAPDEVQEVIRARSNKSLAEIGLFFSQQCPRRHWRD